MKSADKPVKHSVYLKQLMMQVAVAFLIAWGLQLFVLELSWLRNSSMAPALSKGDFILVSKVHYGPRTPATWLKFPLTEPFIGDSIPTFLPYFQLPIFRLPGLGKVKRNDLIYFNHPRKPEQIPADMRAKFFGRCIGLPGDSVKIESLKIAHYQEDTAERFYPYRVILKNNKPLEWLQLKGFTDVSELGNFYLICCTPMQAANLTKDSTVIYIAKAVTPKNVDTETIFPYHRLFSWNAAFFGPLWVPRKGATIPINDSTLALYDWLLEYEQGDNIQFAGTGYEQGIQRKAILNGQVISQYTFEQNYYFVLNDNRNRSESDSRRFGFVPESMIIGKAWLKLVSFNQADGESSPSVEFFKTIR